MRRIGLLLFMAACGGVPQSTTDCLSDRTFQAALLPGITGPDPTPCRSASPAFGVSLRLAGNTLSGTENGIAFSAPLTFNDPAECAFTAAWFDPIQHKYQLNLRGDSFLLLTWPGQCTVGYSLR